MPARNGQPERESRTRPETGVWWGRYDLAEDRTGRWQIGPLRFWLSRSGHEWRFAAYRGDDPMEETLAREVPADGPVPEDADESYRIGFRQTPGSVRLVPLLADRPVVISPTTPFRLPPGEELTLFVSTTLWLRVETLAPIREVLQVPLLRPSDTWFGPTTREGEVCYASRTAARLLLENQPLLPHRALSAVRLRNRADEVLPVERVKLPVPHMSLFADAGGRCWTESVTLEHRGAQELAGVELGRQPPPYASGVKKLGGPREKPAKGLLTRAFGQLLGG